MRPRRDWLKFVYPHPGFPSMGFVATATAKDQAGQVLHAVKIRWRADDPWGAVWRALYDALAMYLPESVDRMTPQHFGSVEVKLDFQPDAEDARDSVYPALRVVRLKDPTEKPKGVKQ